MRKGLKGLTSPPNHQLTVGDAVELLLASTGGADGSHRADCAAADTFVFVFERGMCVLLCYRVGALQCGGQHWICRSLSVEKQIWHGPW